MTVCYAGHCKRATGHDGSMSWFQASFNTQPLHMGDSVTYSAVAQTAAGKTKVKATQGLLCMHNNGSTPQT